MHETPLPRGWRDAELATVGTCYRGRGGTREDDLVNGLPCIRYGDIYTHHGCIVRSFASAIAPEKASAYTALQYGDVVFAGSGETPEEIGKAAAYCGSGVAYAGADTIVFRPSAALDGRFAGYAVNSVSANTYKSRMGQGSSVFHISAEQLGRLRLRVPSVVEEQRRIAEILVTIDDAIEQTEALIAKTQQIKAGLMHDVFTRGVTSDGRLRPSREEAPESYKQSALGWIPAQWDAVRWSELCSNWAMGPRFPASEYSEVGNVATLRTTDIDGEGRIDYAAMPRAHLDLSGFRQHLLHPNDLVISRSGTCGIAAVFTGHDVPVLPGAFLIRFRFGERICPAYLRDFINSPYGARPVARIAEGGVQKNLRGTALCRVWLPVPDRDEQARAQEALLALDARIKAAKASSAKLRSLRSGLMDDLLSGRVKVAVAEPQ